MKSYDLIVVGGGTAGCAAAYIASKYGLKVLLIEKTSQLGGSMTSGLVIPVMNCGDNQINTEFYKAITEKLRILGGQVTYQNNHGWFNPELLKIVLDDLLEEVGADILFCAEISSIEKNKNHINTISVVENKFKQPISTIKYCAKYFIDTTGDAEFAIFAGADLIDNNNKFQPMSLRFCMGGIDLKKFGKWLLDTDSDRNVTTVESIDGQIHLSTACTWDTNTNWALRPYFENGIKEGIITEEDSNYFQVFSVAGMPGVLAFNCPRIIDDLNPNSTTDRTFALKKGRKSILRLANFCKKYFPGFENSYISTIANNLGVRVSNQIVGKYIYKIEDLKNGKAFENPALISNYPVDVHSKDKNTSTLEQNGEYQLPIESLQSKDFDNLFFAGRLLSADYLSQGALRVQATCFSMGEALAHYLVLH